MSSNRRNRDVKQFVYLTQAEADRLSYIAKRTKMSKSEVLRTAFRSFSLSDRGHFYISESDQTSKIDDFRGHER